MKTLIATILLSLTIWSSQSAEFAFEGGISNVSAAIKADTRSVFKAAGFVEHKTLISGAAIWTTTFPVVAEINGGNVGSWTDGYVTTPTTLEYDSGGMAVWWIYGNILTFNRTAKPTEEEVEDALSIFISLF
jgi:hypothetical protein